MDWSCPLGRKPYRRPKKGIAQQQHRQHKKITGGDPTLERGSFVSHG